MNRKAWDNIGSNAAPKELEENRYKKMFELFCSKLPKKAKVLDLGCGPGRIVKELVKREFEVTALDFSKKMIEMAKKDTPKARYVQMSMADMEFENEFDGIVSSFSMLCLNPKNFEKTAKKISKALTQNGLFLLSLNEPNPKKSNTEQDNYTVIMNQKMYSRPYTEGEIRELFSKYRMKILDVKREVTHCKEYGEEYTLVVLMKKN